MAWLIPFLGALWQGTRLDIPYPPPSTKVEFRHVRKVGPETYSFLERNAAITFRFNPPLDTSQTRGVMVRLKSSVRTSVALWGGIGKDVTAGLAELQPREEQDVFFDFRPSGKQAPRSVRPEPYVHVSPYASGSAFGFDHLALVLRSDTPATLTVGSFELIRESGDSAPRVDKYGQLADRDWHGKIRSDADLRTASDPLLAGPTPPSPYLPTNTKAAGWRIEKDAQGYAAFVRPDGKRLWSVGTTTVAPSRATPAFRLAGSELGQAQYRPVINGVETVDVLKSNLAVKYGDQWLPRWTNSTEQRLCSWGFNAIGASSDEGFLTASQLPYVVAINAIGFRSVLIGASGDSRGLIDPFDPTFVDWLIEKWGSKLLVYDRSPRFIGFYADGEVPWGMDSNEVSHYQVPLAMLAALARQPAKKALVPWARRRFASVGEMNARLGIDLASFSQLESRSIRVNVATLGRQAKADLDDLLESFAEQYATAYADVRRKLNLKCLILGGRDLFDTPEPVFRAQAKHFDVLSVDRYARSEDFGWTKLARLPKPVLLSEFSFMAQEGNAMSGVSGNPQVVAPSQAIRALWTDAVLRRAATEPNIVGAHWFSYVDQPATGMPGEGENYAFGLVNVVDQPYAKLVNVFRTFANDLPNLRR